MDARAIFTSAVQILDEIMLPHGFVFREGAGDQSSGGDFASGYYFRAQRKLELHLRGSLRLVNYHIGAISMDHASYMRALLGPAGGNRYPGNEDHPRAEFENLRADLNEFCSDFLTGDGDEFRRCWAIARQGAAKRGRGNEAYAKERR